MNKNQIKKIESCDITSKPASESSSIEFRQGQIINKSMYDTCFNALINRICCLKEVKTFLAPAGPYKIPIFKAPTYPKNLQIQKENKLMIRQ